MTVVEVNGQPCLILTAAKPIDVGDELLFDYNDRQSRLPFLRLRACPVCSTTGDNVDREPEPGPSSAGTAVDAPASEQQQPQQPPLASTSAVDVPPPKRKATSGTDGIRKRKKKNRRSTTVSASGPDTANSEISQLARMDNLDQHQRQQIYDAVLENFPEPTVLTRSNLECFLPGITSGNANQLLLRRNMEVAITGGAGK